MGIRACGSDLEQTDVAYCKDFPLPQPLGSVTFNGMTFIFMTFIEGTTLQELWPSLSAHLKTSVCNQLNTILLNLRSLPLPSTQLGGGARPRCKDVRRSVRCSPMSITNEAEFNDFLLSTTKPRIAQCYKEFIQTKCLYSHHRIVITYSDFHPRNILVELNDGQILQVSRQSTLSQINYRISHMSSISQ